MSLDHTTSQQFRTIQNPITHRKFRLPLLRQKSKAAESSLLQYTNAFLQQPSQFQTLQSPHTQSAVLPNFNTLTPPIVQLPRESLMKKIADEDEALKELKERLQEEQQRNNIVLRSLRKYRPHNSSLTMGYKEVHQSELRRLQDKSAKKRVMAMSQHAKKLLKLKASAFRTIPSNHSSAGKTIELQQIFDIYQTERKIFDHLRNQEKIINAKMDRDYSKIKAACEDILGYGNSMPVTDPRQFTQLRNDMYELSAKCQQVSKSPRRR